VQSSAAGFYTTPKIRWSRAKGRGRPFYYFAYGAACAEVSLDTLTGEYTVERVDALHDGGRSLNPAIHKGQVEGAFVQGTGWLTREELWWDDKGRLRTHAPSAYKTPLASDRPKIVNARLAEWSVNKERTIKRSKAVGEPPFVLAISVFEAIGMAVASVSGYRVAPRLDAAWGRHRDGRSTRSFRWHDRRRPSRISRDRSRAQDARARRSGRPA
jgi:xanthine dehydrogenase large subunit